ncbi:MAG: cytochrome c, partial [Deltaproteobacteria bacterium]|nr:cytochrome c [Deltaproteobacteria bacterium]
MRKIIGFFILVAIVLYGAYEALIYYDNNFIYGRMRETPAVRPHEEPLFNMEAGIVPVNAGEAIYRTTPGVDLVTPLNAAEPFVITRGKAVYLTYCAQCHGYNYDGNGTVGQ